MTKIALIGGSNTILRTGYWIAFAEALGGAELTNLAIGGNSGITGLHQILTQDVFERFDGIIFEYALNDTQHKSVFVRESTVLSTVAAVLRLHQPYRGRKKLLSLVGSPWRHVDEVLAGRCYVYNTYRDALTRAGIPYLDATTFLGERFDRWQDAYESNNHYSPEAMDLMGRELARLWSEAEHGHPGDEIPESPLGWDRMRAIPLEETEITGSHEPFERTTDLRTMPMRRLPYGASIHLPGEGVLYGIFTCMWPEAGEITIRGERTVRKETLNKHWNPARRALFANILMREPMRFVDGLRIDVGADPSLPSDMTPSGLPPRVPPEEAVLEASHLMVGPLTQIPPPTPYKRPSIIPEMTPKGRR